MQNYKLPSNMLIPHVRRTYVQRFTVVHKFIHTTYNYTIIISDIDPIMYVSIYNSYAWHIYIIIIYKLCVTFISHVGATLGTEYMYIIRIIIINILDKHIYYFGMNNLYINC